MAGSSGHDIVVCEPLRTPVGRFGGVFRDVSVQELASTVVGEVVARSGLVPQDVDDVIMGHCYPTMDAPALGRVAWLDAGLPVDVPGRQLDRRCGSGLQAIVDGAGAIASGGAELVIAGGAESMSHAPFYSDTPRWGARRSFTMHDALEVGRVRAGGRHHPVPGGMVETAENLRRRREIPRLDQDELALRSHNRATQAQDQGWFDDEIVPVRLERRGEVRLIREDEHPRRDVSLEALGQLAPVLAKVDPGATVTAGNASGQNDGAAACIVTTRANAERRGLRPLLRLVSWAVAGVAPELMGLGAVPATNAALARAGLELSDLDLIEINEAFAVQVLACLREWGLGVDDLARVNVHGSGISLGHPAGATGARILATLAHAMHRREARFGLETMCIGGGQGIAAVFERV